MNKCNFNCNQGKSCPVPYSCEVPLTEKMSDEPDAIVKALCIAIALLALGLLVWALY
jgi:hypothetical protein